MELAGLERAFGAYRALDGLDLTVERGEFIALLGPSGCGKSTALNCIAGLLPLTGGAILLDGKPIHELAPEERGFGMVFQSYALFPHMTIRKNVGFGLAMQGVPKAEAEARIDAALDLVRLKSQGDKLPGQLSGGQQQRVAIARAIVIRPPLVLMDEPLSNLDAKLRLEMRAEIRAIHEAIGSTTIYVTHDQDEALSLADRIVVMANGVIRQVGTPEELYERPNHVDVADFMGFRTRILGRVTADGSMVELPGGRLALPAARGLRAGTPVTVSVRPEDFVASKGEARGGDGLTGTVRSIEYRGRAWFGSAALPDGTLVYFRADSTLPQGAPVILAPDPARTLIFEETGR
ncbi:spermidine/putrescine ABC transporter ATP-binding protein [Xaviernesmea oryzae]|uniref:Spermidine/putrescine ABC transporter ATP-binding protein n=1 Tax=Xaviernesmea oryzae TaxID=464029 RepID=A0A1Q9B226_9HYPH|nr:spermidine/putrescine ABC transporter ATP-binding protein [Xaviernesmea oryzae]